jgi:dUTPase
MRIAQLVVARVERVDLREMELSETKRGVGGFGSTGTSSV